MTIYSIVINIRVIDKIERILIGKPRKSAVESYYTHFEVTKSDCKQNIILVRET